MLEDLTALLPDHKAHSVYAGAHCCHGTAGSEEGIGLMSKYPIEESEVLHLDLGDGNDANKRVVLYVRVKLPSRSVSFFVVHFSYDKSQQMSNARQLLSFARSKPGPQVALGDFNIYPGNEAPMEVLRRGPWKAGGDTSPSALFETTKMLIETTRIHEVQPIQNTFETANLELHGNHVVRSCLVKRRQGPRLTITC